MFFSLKISLNENRDYDAALLKFEYLGEKHENKHENGI